VVAIDGAIIETFAANFAGELIQPQEPGYDTARQIWNGHVQRRPALIARCRGAADVMAVVRFCREHDWAGLDVGWEKPDREGWRCADRPAAAECGRDRSTFLKKRSMSTVFDEVEVRSSCRWPANRLERGRAGWAGSAGKRGRAVLEGRSRPGR
jgi:hypothetical protein